ncbi:Hypothetical Protein RradSPS_3122 (plasmid) [Rubrobacter radiotolerans]|uniref:Uncharacterized protein n=1 Tax=Rubrobacter radiotolerans TaxID=42256 RepID=A0A023X8P4_RUBRA|nr:Hypothetical Protein RradSPS_3122 [Rubrobacter radiotolerans]
MSIMRREASGDRLRDWSDRLLQAMPLREHWRIRSVFGGA